MRRLYVLTGGEFPQGHPDDQALFSKLNHATVPFTAEWLDWTRSPATQVVPGGVCLIRTPWDYLYDVAGFVIFLEDIEKLGVRIWNPIETIKWNLNKSYLLELQSLGISTVPSVSGEDFLNSTLASESSVVRRVIKPCVGASGRGVETLETREILARLRADSQPRDYLVQDYISSIEKEGETSLIFYHLGGKAIFSHAVRKRPARGEFRVQADFGGSERAEFPESSVIHWAEEILELVDSHLKRPWMYVRVDLLYHHGRPLLGELEMIEPQLFHRFGPTSAELLVRSLLENS